MRGPIGIAPFAHTRAPWAGQFPNAPASRPRAAARRQRTRCPSCCGCRDPPAWPRGTARGLGCPHPRAHHPQPGGTSWAQGDGADEGHRGGGGTRDRVGRTRGAELAGSKRDEGRKGCQGALAPWSSPPTAQGFAPPRRGLITAAKKGEPGAHVRRGGLPPRASSILIALLLRTIT